MKTAWLSSWAMTLRPWAQLSNPAHTQRKLTPLSLRQTLRNCNLSLTSAALKSHSTGFQSESCEKAALTEAQSVFLTVNTLGQRCCFWCVIWIKLNWIGYLKQGIQIFLKYCSVMWQPQSISPAENEIFFNFYFFYSLHFVAFVSQLLFLSWVLQPSVFLRPHTFVNLCFWHVFLSI